MKILAIADRFPQKNIKATLAQYPIELIITLGDLDYSELAELKSITDIPKIGVYGNHCSGTYMEPLGIRNMHLATFSYGGLTFGGFEGSVRYKSSPYAKMYSQEEAYKLLEGYPRVDVMLAHCPPYGINDEPGELAHEGFRALREYVEEKRPQHFLHGHTYPTEADIVRRFAGTEIIYVYESKVIDLLLRP